MSVLFNSIARHNLLDNQPRKWYACIKSIEQFTETDLALRATNEVTLSPKELEMGLYQCQKELIYALLDGKTVHLRELGTFYLTCNGEGVDKQEDLTIDHIKKLNIRFRPIPELREKLKKANLKRVEELLPEKKTTKKP